MATKICDKKCELNQWRIMTGFGWRPREKPFCEVDEKATQEGKYCRIPVHQRILTAIKKNK